MWARIQEARDDEGPHFGINQNKNIGNDIIIVYCNEFSNHLYYCNFVTSKMGILH